MTNWHPTENPHALPLPPAWFLQELRIFDPDLLVFPSRVLPLYRLARKVTRHPGVQTVVNAQSDTAIYWTLACVHVCSLARDCVWSAVIPYLAACDLWRAGGAGQYADRLEDAEATAERRLIQDCRDETKAACHSGWHHFALRAGCRTFIHNPDAPLKLATGVVVVNDKRTPALADLRASVLSAA